MSCSALEKLKVFLICNEVKEFLLATHSLFDLLSSKAKLSFQSLVLSLLKGIFNLAAKPSEAYPSKLH